VAQASARHLVGLRCRSSTRITGQPVRERLLSGSMTLPTSDGARRADPADDQDGQHRRDADHGRDEEPDSWHADCNGVDGPAPIALRPKTARAGLADGQLRGSLCDRSIEQRYRRTGGRPWGRGVLERGQLLTDPTRRWHSSPPPGRRTGDRHGHIPRCLQVQPPARRQTLAMSVVRATVRFTGAFRPGAVRQSASNVDPRLDPLVAGAPSVRIFATCGTRPSAQRRAGESVSPLRRRSARRRRPRCPNLRSY